MLSKLLFIGCILGTCVQSYPTGAPTLACSAMRPEHGLNQPQPLEESPYHVVASVDPSQTNKVLVNISSEDSSTQLKGIFLQARASKYERGIGSWTVPPDNNYRHVDCNEDPTSALTHANRDEKSLPLMFEWTAPEMWESPQTQQFVFYATVVKEYETFYVKIPSNQVTVVY